MSPGWNITETGFKVQSDAEISRQSARFGSSAWRSRFGIADHAVDPIRGVHDQRRAGHDQNHDDHKCKNRPSALRLMRRFVKGCFSSPALCLGPQFRRKQTPGLR